MKYRYPVMSMCRYPIIHWDEKEMGEVACSMEELSDIPVFFAYGECAVDLSV
jgi:hypothetical protein